MFWGQRWMPEAILKDHDSNHAKCATNVAKVAARGCLWKYIGALKGLLGRPWAQFARHCGGCGLYFERFVWKSVILLISMPLCSRIATCVRLGDQVGATWPQKSRPSGPRMPRTGKREEPGQSSQTVGARSSVGVMEITGNCRASAQL